MVFFKQNNSEQKRRCYLEVDEERQGVHDRCDEGACHYCGVEADLLGDHGEGTADELCYQDCYRHRNAYDCCRVDLYLRVAQDESVEEHYLEETEGCETDAAEDGCLYLFPDDLGHILEFKFAKAQGTDYRD